MEFAGIFILVVLAAIVAVLGGGLYLLTMYLRGRQLDPQGDKIEGPAEGEERPRPEHVEVENEHGSRFVGTR